VVSSCQQTLDDNLGSSAPFLYTRGQKNPVEDHDHGFLFENSASSGFSFENSAPSDFFLKKLHQLPSVSVQFSVFLGCRRRMQRYFEWRTVALCWSTPLQRTLPAKNGRGQPA